MYAHSLHLVDDLQEFEAGIKNSSTTISSFNNDYIYERIETHRDPFHSQWLE